MHLYRTADEFVVHAPAKLNLFFEVLAKRSDGYHEIETLMCPVSLCDTLYFRRDPNGRVELRCQWVPGSAGPSGAAGVELPEGPENLAFRAVELLRRRAGIAAGASLRLIKRIPLSSGLGGGSSDAAAALVAANQAWGLNCTEAQLASLAAELGSDVPFFLANGPAICRGRGELIDPVAGLGSLHFVVVRPEGGLSTRAVYAACRPAASARPLSPLLEAFRRGEISRAGRLLFNRLQPAAAGLSPWIERLRLQFDRLDCLGHAMSGSGTCYFGLCRHARHARRIAACLAATSLGSVFTVRSCR